jgi:hypothetical protein
MRGKELSYVRGKGTKLGEGIRDFYVWDFYHFRDLGFLRSGLFCSRKVCGATNINRKMRE